MDKISYEATFRIVVSDDRDWENPWKKIEEALAKALPAASLVSVGKKRL